MIDKMNDQDVVDAFTATRRVKRIRPEFIADVTQYRYLFSVAQCYLQTTEGTDVDAIQISC